jgi:curved DNA-binding protein CbpA
MCVLIPEIVQNNRDHRAVLELPVNLHQLSKEKQCSYVKKAHKALARKWHPDKVCTRAQRERQRERERERDRQTDRQKDRERDRVTDADGVY